LRCSASVAFLNSIRDRTNLTILTNAHVQRIEFDPQKKATGVVVVGEGGRAAEETILSLRESKESEVILSAGAICSPQILELSGVGRKDEMERLNVPPIFFSEGVGENLQDHLQIRSVYKVTTPTLNDEVLSLPTRIAMGLEFLIRGTGPLTLAASQVGAFVNVLGDPDGRPDLQFHIQPLSASGKVGSISGLDNFSGFTSSVCQLRPRSRGRLILESRDSRVAPLINPNYLADEFDQKTVVAGMKFSRRIMENGSISKYVAKEIVPGERVDTYEALLDCARRVGESIYHPVGTCKMGPEEDATAVVDPRLRVRGVHGVRVADCSIMPSIVSGNTNAPAIVIGEKAAELILEDLQK
jgi:choline dehydrogenase